MAGNIGGDAGKTGRTEPTQVQASTGTYREDIPARYALFITQVCIKMFWRSFYAVAAGYEEMTHDEEAFIYGLGAVLFAADLVVQVFFLENTFDRRKHKETNQLVYYAGCGVAFVFAYNLCFLPCAGSITDVYRVASWVGFIFNFGCLVELELGLFQKCVVALPAARQE